MTPLKSIFALFLVLVPGGFLVLLALATAKAFSAGFERLLGKTQIPVYVPVRTDDPGTSRRLSAQARS